MSRFRLGRHDNPDRQTTFHVSKQYLNKAKNLESRSVKAANQAAVQRSIANEPSIFSQPGEVMYGPMAASMSLGYFANRALARWRAPRSEQRAENLHIEAQLAAELGSISVASDIEFMPQVELESGDN